MAESAEAHQRSFDRGIQIGHQRRNKVGPVPVVPFVTHLHSLRYITGVEGGGNALAFVNEIKPCLTDG